MHLTLESTLGCILVSVAMSSKGYQIGTLAKLTGLTPDALRYYERQGLLDKPVRTSGRFRIYDSTAIDRLRFIKRAKALGFTLVEIKELVRFNGQGGLRRCRRVRDLLRNQLAVVDSKRAELDALCATLRTTLEECEGAIATSDASACPVIELTSDEERDGVM